MQDKREFLPISKEDMKQRGWQQCDFVFVIGDAYVAVSYTHLDVYKRQAAVLWAVSASLTPRCM